MKSREWGGDRADPDDLVHRHLGGGGLGALAQVVSAFAAMAAVFRALANPTPLDTMILHLPPSSFLLFLSLAVLGSVHALS